MDCRSLPLDRVPNDHRALALMADVSLRAGKVHDALALYVKAVNAAPDIHLYKERFLELAARGLNIAHSEAARDGGGCLS